MQRRHRRIDYIRTWGKSIHLRVESMGRVDGREVRVSFAASAVSPLSRIEQEAGSPNSGFRHLVKEGHPNAGDVTGHSYEDDVGSKHLQVLTASSFLNSST